MTFSIDDVPGDTRILSTTVSRN